MESIAEGNKFSDMYKYIASQTSFQIFYTYNIKSLFHFLGAKEFSMTDKNINSLPQHLHVSDQNGAYAIISG